MLGERFFLFSINYFSEWISFFSLQLMKIVDENKNLHSFRYGLIMLIYFLIVVQVQELVQFLALVMSL